MTAMDFIPPELMAWSDIPLILLCVGISHVLRPFFDPDRLPPTPWQDFFRGDRIMALPFLVGIAIGFIAEATTPEFDMHMAIRRTLTTGCGAAAGFRAAKVFFPHWFADHGKDSTLNDKNRQD